MLDAQAVLDCRMLPNDAGAGTVRAYLVRLAREVWREGEGFSGKRPFGNSSWEHEIYASLVNEGIIDGHFDSDGYLEGFDRAAGNVAVAAALAALECGA